MERFLLFLLDEQTRRHAYMLPALENQPGLPVRPPVKRRLPNRGLKLSTPSLVFRSHWHPPPLQMLAQVLERERELVDRAVFHGRTLLEVMRKNTL
jgi:hypothetical protein